MQQAIGQEQIGHSQQPTMVQAQQLQQLVQQQHQMHQQLAQQQQHLVQQQQMVQQQQPMVQQQLTQQQLTQQMLQQQLSQNQMMYCPTTVRLVYDSPVLMQPGEQIQQQNQNIFVNQPPWARPVQNQVIYVQQIGSNLVPVQQIDPNFYIQQNMPMYQQVVQNVPQLMQNIPQTITQGQIRPIMNNVQSLVQNIHTIQDQNIGQLQNYGFIQTNQDLNTANANSVNNDVDRLSNNQMSVQNIQSQDINQVYRHMVPQVNQQQAKPMMQVINQVQNVPNVQTIGQQIVTNVGQNLVTNIRPITSTAGQNILSNILQNNARPSSSPAASNISQNVSQNVSQTASQNLNQNVNQNINQVMSQNVRQNASPSSGTNTIITGLNTGSNMQQIRHVNPTQTVNFIPRSVQPNYVNTSVNNQTTFVSTVGNLSTVTYSAVRNGQPYTYRAIQPKPNANTNVRANFTPKTTQMPMIRKPVPNVMQNNISNVNTVPIMENDIRTEQESPVLNRKRKSESPDEIQKKVSNYGSITVTSQVKDKIRAKYSGNTSEIGVNTSPVHKPKPMKVDQQRPLLQINPMESKIISFLMRQPELTMPTATLNTQSNNLVRTEIPMDTSEKKDVSQQTEAKVVRKTVFPQARGRLLDDKVNINLPKEDDSKMSIDVANTDIAKLDKTVKDSNSKLITKTDKLENKINILSSQVVVPSVEEPKSQPSTLPATNEVTQNRMKPLNDTADVTICIKVTKESSKTKDTQVESTVRKYSLPVNIQNKTVLLNNDHKEDAIKELKITEGSEKPKVDEVKSEPEKIVETKKAAENKKVEKVIETKKILEMKKVVEIEKVVETEKVEETKKEKLIETEKNAKSLEPKTVKVEVSKTDKDMGETKLKTDFDQVIKDSKIEKKEYKNISISEMSGKEIHMVDGSIRKEEKEKDFVLTHVLDGYVIQESNVPFAIRRPLKEKTINAVVDEKPEAGMNVCKNLTKEEMKDKILELSQLHLEEGRDKEKQEIGDEKEDVKPEENEKEMSETPVEKIEDNVEVKEVIQKDDPFSDLKQSVVKTWTVEDLASHLMKHSWTETVSILQEHEIDGESLFLVTKTQLVTIGINETHADVICEFVGSKS